MIDFFTLTNFNRPVHQLEEMILALVAAAGHNGPASAKAVDRFLESIRNAKHPCDCNLDLSSPFDCIKYTGPNWLSYRMKIAGIGCNSMNKKGGTFWVLANSGVDLKTCTREELCKFNGIGMKTASCFVLHSRPNQQMASLDRHILKIVGEKYPKAPKQTPGSFKNYYKWEKVVLKDFVSKGMTPAEFDLRSWIVQRKNDASNVVKGTLQSSA